MRDEGVEPGRGLGVGSREGDRPRQADKKTDKGDRRVPENTQRQNPHKTSE